MWHLRAVLPDWESLDSVRSVHSLLEGGALIFFAALVALDLLAHFSEEKHKHRAKTFERIGLVCFGVAVLAEIVAYPYGRRNDFLAEQQNKAYEKEIAVLENSTQQLKTNATAASATAAEADARTNQLEHDNLTLRAGVASLEIQAANARTKQAQAEARLFDLQRHNISRMVMSQPPGPPKNMAVTRIEVMYARDDSEAYSLADQIWGWLASKEWPAIKPIPIPSSIPADKTLEVLRVQPLGVTITAAGLPDGSSPSNPVDLLSKWLASALGTLSEGRDTTLPPGALRIVVMPKG